VPLITIDLVAGRSKEDLVELLDTVHRAMVDAFDVPVRDRYQIVHEHEPAHMVVEDTGLGLQRSPDVVVVRVTSRRRSREQKEAFYRLLAEQLQRRCNIKPTDVVVAVTENTDEDWSFGLGRAQFLTGEL
jgi:phenylpyruvate tautomerase PptA (4-oxalocrotonate tautomerase family)